MPPSRSRPGSGKSTGSGGSTSSGNKGGTPFEINLRYGPQVGYVLADLRCDFIGSCPVTQASGQEVAADGVKRIKGLKSAKKQVHLVVSTNGLFIIDAQTKAIVKETVIQEVSFVGLDATTKNGVIFISNNESLRLMTLYSFKGSKQPDDVPIAINEAFMIKGGKIPTPDPSQPRRKMTMKEAQEHADRAKKDPKNGANRRPSLGKAVDPSFIGAFEARYICSLAVTAKSGIQVVEDALARASEIGLPDGVGCIIIVSSEGLRILDGITQEPFFQTVIKEVTFTTVVGNKGAIFAYISENDTTGRIVCHMFNRGSFDGANELATGVGKAFVQARKEAIANANPFLVKDATRTECPAQLFKRQLRRATLTPTKMIGAGQFGQVWLGEYQSKPDVKSQKVAVKLLRGASSESDKAEFTRECEMMMILNHKNLVSLIGVSLQQKPWLCVLEFLSYGDIKGVLEGCEEKGVKVTGSYCVWFCHQILQGMIFMANKNLVHMDLAARNVLLHSKNNVKVADFGLTHELDAKGEFRLPEGIKLPMKWMSPEAMDIRVFSEKSDVWAYGITMWEIFSFGAMPYTDYKTSEIQIKVREGLRLEEPDLAPDGVFAVITECWHLSRKKRPTFATLLESMDKLLANCGDTEGDLGKALKHATEVKKKKNTAPTWYMGTMSKDAADKATLNAAHGDFLVRQIANEETWVITVNDTNTLKHFGVKHNEEEKFVFAGQVFDSLKLVVKSLKTNQFKGQNGPMVLGNPVKLAKIQKKQSIKAGVGVGGDGGRRPSTGSQGSKGSKGSKSSNKGNSKSSNNSNSKSSNKGSNKSTQSQRRPSISSVSSTGKTSAKVGEVGKRKPSVKKPSAKGVQGVTATVFNPTTNKTWQVDFLPKSTCVASLRRGKAGDFFVRCNDDKTKYYIMFWDGSDTDPTSLTVFFKDDKFVFSKQQHDSLDDLLKAIGNRELKGKSGEPRRLLQPCRLVTIDVMTDTSWLVNAKKKEVCESSLKAGAPGDFLVRHNKTKTKYFVMLHDGPREISSVTLKVVDDNVTFGTKSFSSVEAAVTSMIGSPIKGKSGNYLYLVRTCAIVKPKSNESATTATITTTTATTATEEFGGFEEIPKHEESYEGFDGGDGGVAATNPEPSIDEEVVDDDDDDDDEEDEEDEEDKEEETEKEMAEKLRDSAVVRANAQMVKNKTMEKKREWMGGTITDDRADAIFKTQDDGSYVVRILNNDEHELMVKDGQKIAKFPIKFNKGSFSCGTVTSKTLNGLIPLVARESLQSNVSTRILYLGAAVPSSVHRAS